LERIVGTQRTFLQLIQYLKKRLGPFFWIASMCGLCSCSRLGGRRLMRCQSTCWQGRIPRRFKNVELEAVTGKGDLPYRKSIHFGSVTGREGQTVNGTPDVS
jgi:hypothetical protein